MTSHSTFNIGDRVTYENWDGETFTGIIVYKTEKDGREVYDVDLDNGETAYGYYYQFSRL